MATQTLLFVVLPNGITARNTLRLSIYLTPRLDQGGTLAQFPDILHWPAAIVNSGLKFQIKCAAKTTSVTVDTKVLRADVWEEIFKANTFVEAYQIPNFDKRLIVSYPVRNALSYLKWAYQQVGTGLAFGDEERGGLRGLLGDLTFREGTNSLLQAQLAAMRVQMWNEQHGTAAVGGGAVTSAAAGLQQTAPPDGVPTILTEPANTHDTMTRFALFHHMPPAPNRPPLPSGSAGFAKTLDFHRALTALNSYPALLRALGLVFDVEVPSSFCPNSPGSAYGTLAIAKVEPGFKWSLAPKFSFPATAYYRDKVTFSAAPATAPADLATKSYVVGDVVGGLLALPADGFHLLPVDLDGALLKALGLADNLAFMDDPTTAGDALASLRSSGIGLIANGRAEQLLQTISSNMSFNQALTTNAPFPRPFNVCDLLRGFRIDVWSSRTRQWYSLHRRNSSYTFGTQPTIAIDIKDEEGFLQPTAAQPAADPTRKSDPVATANGISQPGTDLFIHERVARWEGWSLSAPRPGKALNRSPDPGQALTSDSTLGQPLTPFKMRTSFAAQPGSLPELRFGLKYRFRARAVDLAGNSVPLTSPTPALFALPAAGVELPYLRFEPVAPPLLVLQTQPLPGGSLERMVIRATNSSLALDAAPTGQSDSRHVAPPRISMLMAEQHGLFDDNNGKPRGDQATYNLIVARDDFAFNTVPPAPAQGVPIEPGTTLNVGYFPDPIARGAAFRDLPNTPDNTNGRLTDAGLTYNVLPDVQPRPGSVTYIDFGTQWPGRTAFLLTIVEGGGPPSWDAANRELTVSLPKGSIVTVDLSSYFSQRDLTFLGVWGWLCEFFEASEIDALQGGGADSNLSTVTDLIALLTRLVLEGGLDLLSPARMLTLVHAVQQPLGQPTFVQLPVVHQPADPVLASALRNSFTAITAWRSVGSHQVVLLGALQVHALSTSKIDLQARWLEVTDDPTLPGPTSVWNSDHIETIPLASTEPGAIASDATGTRLVAVYIPKVDTLWFAAPFDELAGVDTPSVVAAPLHHFDDTKHRWVRYQAIATSDFQEYFPPNLDFTRPGIPLFVDVPSSARPTAPDVVYVVPIFGWERQETTNVKTSVRFGNGLRVYLNRPWYSSGDNELLGVVLWNSTLAAPDYATRDTYKPFFTQWGNDPIWKTAALNPVPGMGDFANAVATAPGLTLEETAQTFDVAGHDVGFDEKRGLWYCDITFYTSTTYAPFVRLALARYQPHSIQGVELSRVVLADFAQLAPDRSAIVSIDPANTRQARIFVGGVAPQDPGASSIQVTVERRLANLVSDLGWETAPANVVRVTEAAPDATEPDAVLWSGTVLFAKTPPPGQFRVVFREYEHLPIDPPASGGDGPLIGQRLVYAAIVPYDYPS